MFSITQQHASLFYVLAFVWFCYINSLVNTEPMMVQHVCDYVCTYRETQQYSYSTVLRKVASVCASVPCVDN